MLRRVTFETSVLLVLCMLLWSCGSKETSNTTTEVGGQGKTEEAAATPVVGRTNLFPNPTLEAYKGRADLPKGVTIYKAEFFSCEVKPDPASGNILITTKLGEDEGDFDNAQTEVAIEPGKSYEVGYSYLLSPDFKGKIGVQAAFLPITAQAPTAMFEKAPKMKPSKEWRVTSLVVEAPEGAEKMRVYLPRILKFEAGSVSMKEPFVYEKKAE